MPVAHGRRSRNPTRPLQVLILSVAHLFAQCRCTGGDGPQFTPLPLYCPLNRLQFHPPLENCGQHTQHMLATNEGKKTNEKATKQRYFYYYTGFDIGVIWISYLLSALPKLISLQYVD